jgi:regulator of protease activity HflC (stomatin/prohibitin superfamily)
MEVFGQLISFIKEIFSWWFIITPWEQAVFVRAGKNIKVLKEGIYFKIPFIDQVYLQQIRLRTVDLPIQTVSTSDNKTITIKSVMTYSITDMYMLYNTISNPETTLAGIVMSEISDYIRSTDSKGLNTVIMEQNILTKLQERNFGLGDLTVRITSYAEVKTFRLIQDQSWMYAEGINMDKNKK